MKFLEKMWERDSRILMAFLLFLLALILLVSCGTRVVTIKEQFPVIYEYEIESPHYNLNGKCFPQKTLTFSYKDTVKLEYDYVRNIKRYIRRNGKK